jgi:hypothetical protein
MNNKKKFNSKENTKKLLSPKISNKTDGLEQG